ncbi:hypothetical protein D3C78_514290 [compost metagenome]
MEDVFVEFTPEQLVDPGHQPLVTTVKLTQVVRQRPMQALTRGNDPGCEVRRELASARDSGKIALLLIVLNGFVDKALQARFGLGFPCWPQFAQAGSGWLEPCHLGGNRVAGNC